MNKQEIIEKYNKLKYEIELATKAKSRYEKDLFIGVEVRLQELDKAIQYLTTEPPVDNEAMREHAIGLDNILQLIKSDSVYALLRRGFKSPSSSGVDDCEDNDYIDLYNLSVTLRTNNTTNT